MMFVFAGIGVQAQNTGAEPFEGSTHSYRVTKSATLTTALAWTIEGDAGGYEFVGDTDKETVSVKWKSIGDYTLVLTEQRSSGDACPTIRKFPVKVVANNFNVIASIVGNADGCAGISNPVKDEGSDGSNANDVFGQTQRVFNVKMEGGDLTKDWTFKFDITGAVGFDGYDVAVSGATEASGVYTVAGAAPTATESNVATITVTYNTNKQTANNGQDPDVILKLTVSDAKDGSGTSESAANIALNNVMSYNINAVPATTPIIVVN
ncbi:hypothetical protein DF185_20590 [Marinifilum breve]|uniref:PKD domain-containing protein n=2 Tax=Marinifilum breve TaxID=2184082 RepID=A0A2V3ZSR7_9BACT|nr:hypothetical protein DF185_20590 [Marinifilum breve]